MRIELKFAMRKVNKAYEIVYPNAISVRKGSILLILREETNPAWSGWVGFQVKT
jgi:hypothetical protein